MAICISVIGKDNSPQFIASTNQKLSLQLQYQLHTALDVVEEKLSTLSMTDNRKHYLGYLHSTEEHKIVCSLLSDVFKPFAGATKFPFYSAFDSPCSELLKQSITHIYHFDSKSKYGYATNTKIKFVIIVDASNVTLRDNDIQTMFRKLHYSYVDVMSNPFYIPGDPLASKKFQNVVNEILSGSA